MVGMYGGAPIWGADETSRLNGYGLEDLSEPGTEVDASEGPHPAVEHNYVVSHLVCVACAFLLRSGAKE